MSEKLKFETTDLVKMIVLLVLVAVAALLYFGQDQTGSMASKGGELPIEIEETTQPMLDTDSEVETQAPEEQAGEISDTGEETGEITPEEQPVGGQEGQDYPEIPASSQELTVIIEEGKITTSDGTVVYFLSVDKKIWIPAVPVDYSESTGGAAPQQDSTGNWYLPGEGGEYLYVWDPENLAWVDITDQEQIAIAPEEPAGGEAETDQETSAEEPLTETGTDQETSAEQSGEEQEAEDKTVPDTSTSESASGETQTSTDSGEEVAEQPGLGAEAIPTPVTKKPKTYTMRFGEHVYCIARRFDLDPYSILRMNGLRVNSIIRTGTVLKLPQYGGSFPGNRALKSHPAEYIVKKGDTIYSIACQYGDVSPEAIATVNQLDPPYTLVIGETLSIP